MEVKGCLYAVAKRQNTDTTKMLDKLPLLLVLAGLSTSTPMNNLGNTPGMYLH